MFRGIPDLNVILIDQRRYGEHMPQSARSTHLRTSLAKHILNTRLHVQLAIKEGPEHLEILDCSSRRVENIQELIPSIETILITDSPDMDSLPDLRQFIHNCVGRRTARMIRLSSEVVEEEIHDLATWRSFDRSIAKEQIVQYRSENRIMEGHVIKNVIFSHLPLKKILPGATEKNQAKFQKNQAVLGVSFCF